MEKADYEIIKEKIFDFVYLMALRDATMRKAYSGEANDREEMKKKANSKEVKGIVKRYIDDILQEGHTDINAADLKTMKAIEDVKSEMKDQNFTFGNAQKLINMTVKYFYISFYNDDDDDEMHKKFRFCHCPMDSIMIKKVRNLMTVEEKKKMKLKGDTSWSKLDCKAGEMPKEYEVFQNAISEKCKECDISPIEFDYLEWHESNNKKKTND